MKIAPEDKNYRVITDLVSATLIYTGWAELGTSTSDALWRIQRTQKTGNIWYDEWADGNDRFDNVFDNRTSLAYT
jgi:hypothetical protein